MSIKTIASIGQLLNRVTDMFKMSFKSFLKKKKTREKEPQQMVNPVRFI